MFHFLDFSKLDVWKCVRAFLAISLALGQQSSGIRLIPEEQELARDIMLQHAGGNNYAVAKAAIRSYPEILFSVFQSISFVEADISRENGLILERRYRILSALYPDWGQ